MSRALRWIVAVTVPVAAVVLGVSCSSSGGGGDGNVQQLLVRKASGGTMDVAGTAWSDCRANEPSTGMSRRKALAFGTSTITATEEVFTASIDCTGSIDPAQRISVTAQASAQGDRDVGWDDGPPPALATTVTATAVLFHGFTPGSIPDLKELLLVNDGASPMMLHEGSDTGENAPDGYPTKLQTSGKRRDAASSRFQGLWASDCVTSGTTSVKHTRLYSGNYLSGTNITWASTDCTGSATPGRFGGTVTFGEQVAAALGAATVTAHQVDLTTQVGTAVYTIAYVDIASNPARYYFGDQTGAQNGSTPALRPTALLVRPLAYVGAPPSADAISALLQGTWVACKAIDTTSEQTTFTFSGSMVEQSQSTYPNLTCAGAPTTTLVRTGTFSIGPAVTTLGLGSPIIAHHIDVTWSGGTFYGLISVDTSANPDRLLFGDESGVNDGSIPAKRPMEIGSGYAVKQ